MAGASLRLPICRRVGRLLVIRRHQGQHGAALVEFAVVFPVLVMVLFGAWEFGRIFDAWQISTNASREGARYAVATGDDTVAANQTWQYLSDAYGARLKPKPEGDVAAAVSVIHPVSGQVSVVVTVNVDIWAPAVAPLIGSSTFPLTAWTTMRQ